MANIAFKARLYTIGSWTILRLPLDASKQLPSRGQTMVKGTINSIEFQCPLEPDGTGSHWVEIGCKMQKAAKVTVGDTVTVQLESTKIWPEPAIPADIQKALSKNAPARNVWKIITPMARHEWIRWINATCQTETRKRRVSVACAKLAAGERRPCCFNRNLCCVPDVSKNGVLLQSIEPAAAAR